MTGKERQNYYNLEQVNICKYKEEVTQVDTKRTGEARKHVKTGTRRTGTEKEKKGKGETTGKEKQKNTKKIKENNIKLEQVKHAKTKLLKEQMKK